MTNGDMIRLDYIPCETNPGTGGLSRTTDPFHAKAELTVGTHKGNLLHVCASCQKRYHKFKRVQAGVVWPGLEQRGGDAI